MINSKKVLYNKIGDDENYTPEYAVQPILRYISANAIIWCPFDTEQSEFVKQIKAKGNKVIFSHIKFSQKLKDLTWTSIKHHYNLKDQAFQYYYLHPEQINSNNIGGGKDFFEYEPKKWDIIISNPPFKNKRKFFEKALSFNKPFALLMTMTWLNDAAPKQLFKDRDLQLLMFDKRIKFINPEGRPNNKITFSSGYYCWNFLPKQIIMKSLK